MRQQVKIDFRLEARIQHDAATGTFVTWCPQLDIYSQGETEELAKRALTNGLKLFLAECYHRKALDDYLLDHGFDVEEDPAAGAARMTSESGEITVKDPRFTTYMVDLPLLMQVGGRSRQRGGRSRQRDGGQHAADGTSCPS